MENHEEYFYSGLLIYMIIIIAVNIVVRLWYFVKCRRIEDCKNEKCIFKEFCFRYQDGITEEEAEELIEYIKGH